MCDIQRPVSSTNKTKWAYKNNAETEHEKHNELYNYCIKLIAFVNVIKLNK